MTTWRMSMLCILMARRGVATATAALLLAVGCSDGSPTGPTSGHLTLVNATADSVGYYALTQEAAALADVIFVPIPASGFRGHLVAAHTSAPVPVTEIDGYQPGAGVVFFVFRVAGGQVEYRTSVSATGADLTRRQFRVEIPATAFSR